MRGTSRVELWGQSSSVDGRVRNVGGKRSEEVLLLFATIAIPSEGKLSAENKRQQYTVLS